MIPCPVKGCKIVSTLLPSNSAKPVYTVLPEVPGPHTSKPHPEHVKYPYLLRDLAICAPLEVWCTDITYVPMARGFMYLAAVMDWFSRYVLAWEVSNSLESGFRVTALKRALKKGHPGIFNTDQGVQFTSEEFTGVLGRADVRISMDGRGRALDNVFIERLWRSVKYEDIYLREYADGLRSTPPKRPPPRSALDHTRGPW